MTLGNLILLGIGGGLVPCGDAIALFGLCVKWQRPQLAFPLVLAFSVGLASVLVAIGLGVVWGQRLLRPLGKQPAPAAPGAYAAGSQCAGCDGCGVVDVLRQRSHRD